MNKPQLSRRAVNSRQNISPVRQIMMYANPAHFIALGLKPEDVISFAGGWVNHKLPPELQEAYKDIVSDDQLMHVAGGYSATSGREECKEALASYEKHVYDIPDIGPLNITVGANSTQILFDLMCVLLDPGDKILMLDPSYCNYPSQIVTNTKAKIIRFPVVDVRTWTYDAGSRTQSFADFIRKEKPKVILLTSPDNPTSQVLPHDFVKAALVAVQSIGGFMVMDFAYKDMVFDTPLPEYFSWSPTPHFMSVHSNSKWCRGLGRRLGWVEASEEIIQALESVQSSTILAPDTLHQMALERYFSVAIKKDTLRPYLRKVASDYKKAAN